METCYKENSSFSFVCFFGSLFKVERIELDMFAYMIMSNLNRTTKRSGAGGEQFSDDISVM